MVPLALVLAVLLIITGAIAGRALAADPAFLSGQPRGEVVDGGFAAGHRFAPAAIGDTLRWSTPEGGTVTVVVDRAETIYDDSDMLHRTSLGAPKCQEWFGAELTVSYDGAGSFTPAEDLTVQQMIDPFGTRGARIELEEELAAPLLAPGLTVGAGESATGTVLFAAAAGKDFSGNLVIGPDEGRPIHVSVVQPGPEGGCVA
jgi:hypothetical protein